MGPIIFKAITCPRRRTGLNWVDYLVIAATILTFLAVIAANQRALARLQGPRAIEIIPDAGHFFTEPGALTAVTAHAAQWFAQHLPEGGNDSLTLASEHHRAYPKPHCAYHAVR